MRKTAERYKELILEFGTSALLVVSGALWAYFALRGIREPLILHFSAYTGINQIGSPGDLLWVAVFGCVVIAMNAAIAGALEVRFRPLARVAGLSTLFVSALLFIGFVAIISVNS